MKRITNIMINMYGMEGRDWFGYKVSKDNPYTYHHIKKKCCGGKETIENGAILTKYAHRLLHIVENREPEMYEYLNIVLKQINEQGFMSIERQLMVIDYILTEFEKKHKDDKTSKGGVLLRGEYKRGRNEKQNIRTTRRYVFYRCR